MNRSDSERIENIEENLKFSHYAMNEGRLSSESFEIMRKDAKRRILEIRAERRRKSA